MDVKYINPFIDSVVNMMETMIDVTPVQHDIRIKKDSDLTGDVSGIIGFADKGITGAVALSFPGPTAMKVYELMMSEAVSSLNSDVKDIVGEMTNIVAGGAKRTMAESGFQFHISIPSVITGKNHSIFHKVGTPVIVVPFSVQENPFFMEISMKFD